jgi:ParB family transcriptional regulator, chromosome partitioning protein
MSERVLVSVNPFRCRMWDLHDRLDCEISEESCREEIVSFAKHGQLVPALARVLRGHRDFDFELIYGARRLFVAQHVNKPLLIEIRDLPDREAIVAMDIENRQRRDISPYERGLSYALWMREGHFSSQEEIARALKVSASQVSRLLRLARLPSIVVSAFGKGSDIRESWGLQVADALEDPHRRQVTIQCARSLSKLVERPPAHEIYRRLVAASVPGRKLKRASHDEVVSAKNGNPVFRIRYQRKSVALVLPTTKVSAQVMNRIRHAMTNILQDENPQVADLRGGRSRIHLDHAGQLGAHD